MSISLVGNPTYSVNPVYNPLVYYFDSTNKSESGFRYVSVIKDSSGDILFEKTLIPDIDNNYGVLHLNRELSDYISYNLDLDNLDSLNYNASDSYLEYEIEVGEEYYEVWDFDDFGFVSGGTSSDWPNATDPLYNPDGGNKTMLYNSSTASIPPYTNGDNIFVTLNPGTQSRPQIQGVHKVLDVYDNGGTGGVDWVVVLDLGWVGSGTSTGGSTRYSNNRKTRFSNLLSVSGEYAINTVLNKKDFLNWDYNEYEVSSVNSDIKFLSQVYNNYRIKQDSTIFLNWLNYNTTSLTRADYVKFRNNNGDESDLTLNYNSDWTINGMDFSPTRTNWGGTASIVDSNTSWYSVQLYSLSNNPITEEIRFDIDRTCGSIDETEVLFMDKFGSFLPYIFEGRAIESHNINKSSYQRYLGGYDSSIGGYSYNLQEGGMVPYSGNYNRSFVLNTGYLSSEESEFFKNVVESPVTYLKIDDEYQRCYIKTTNVEIKKNGWYEGKRYTLNVELSNKENINI